MRNSIGGVTIGNSWMYNNPDIDYSAVNQLDLLNGNDQAVLNQIKALSEVDENNSNTFIYCKCRKCKEKKEEKRTEIYPAMIDIVKQSYIYNDCELSLTPENCGGLTKKQISCVITSLSNGEVM